jgi:hypothetical protein
MKISLLLPLMLVALNVCAFDGQYFGPDKSTWANTDYRKTKNDFAAWLLVTSDIDWQEKWNTPPETVPRFNEADRLKVGERVVILTFFVNPKTDEINNAKVLCSLKVIRPDSTVSIEQSNIPCLVGEMRGNPNYVRMSPAVIQFTGEETDPLGEYVVEVSVSDVLRKTTLDLKTKFTLESE